MRIEKLNGSVWEVHDVKEADVSKFLEEKKTDSNHVFLMAEVNPIEGWIGPKSTVSEILDVAEHLGFPPSSICRAYHLARRDFLDLLNTTQMNINIFQIGICKVEFMCPTISKPFLSKLIEVNESYFYQWTNGPLLKLSKSDRIYYLSSVCSVFGKM